MCHHTAPMRHPRQRPKDEAPEHGAGTCATPHLEHHLPVRLVLLQRCPHLLPHTLRLRLFVAMRALQEGSDLRHEGSGVSNAAAK